MSALILSLFIGAAYLGWKKRSIYWSAGAVAILGVYWVYPYSSFSNDFLGAVVIIIHLAIGFGIFKMFRNRKKPSMNLVVGRVLDNNTSRTVYSDTHIGQDVAGNLSTYTTHEVGLDHNTWLRDLNNDIDINYSGSGSIQARPGHILGTMSYGGTSFMDINYSTGKVFTLPKTSKSIFKSVIVAALAMITGWAFFPLIMLLSPFVWSGAIKWNGGKGFWFSTNGPGSHSAEAILTYIGGIIYGLAVIGILMSITQESSMGLTLIAILFACLIILHQCVARLKFNKEVALYKSGEAELDKLYKAGVARENSRAAESRPATPVGAVEAMN